MTIEKYKQIKKEIEKKHRNEIQELDKRYALANNPYKIGDIIRYKNIVIKIDKIVIICLTHPSCEYFGYCVNKDGTLSKKRNYIFQTWLREK